MRSTATGNAPTREADVDRKARDDHAHNGVAAGRGRRGSDQWRTATRARSSIAVILLPVVGLGVMLAGWWGAVLALDLPRIILPPPPDVAVALVERFPYLLEEGWITLAETLFGYGMTVVGGVLIGVLIASSLTAGRMFSPWLVAFNTVPKVALAPLLVVWMGFGMGPRIAMVILMCFFPIVLSTAAGLTKIPIELVELGRSLDASRLQMFKKIRFPHAMPQIFVGLKVAMPLAVVGAVIGEFRGRGGLGQVIVNSGASGDAALAFAAIVVLSVMSVLLYYLLVWVERLALPWVRATTN